MHAVCDGEAPTKDSRTASLDVFLHQFFVTSFKR